jgi:DivIVA domain-containing protein
VSCDIRWREPDRRLSPLAIDRQTIEKKDFPIGRRGYDVAAVDEHLARIAAEVEQLSSRPPTLASAASDQVSAIVEAAERTANQIEEQAQADARTTRESAEADAQQTRDGAVTEAREYVARVAEGSASMTDRVDAMEQEITSALDQLRQRANRLTSALQLLEEGMSGLRGPVDAGPVAGPLPAAAPTAEFEPVLTDTDALAEADLGPTDEIQVVEPEPEVIEVDAEVAEDAEPVESVTEAEPGPAAIDEDDAEGARLVALNMALNGTPREDTDQYLAEHFELEDRTALLDEVYATVGE